MSAPHIILDNLPSLCQKLSDLVKFDVVLTKIIFLFFETRCRTRSSSVVTLVRTSVLYLLHYKTPTALLDMHHS